MSEKPKKEIRCLNLLCLAVISILIVTGSTGCIHTGYRGTISFEPINQTEHIEKLVPEPIYDNERR